MENNPDKEFGAVIGRLIRKENLTREESRAAFVLILNDGTTPMQQGAFLAALAAKGETEDEVAGSWEAIYSLDTTKVSVAGDIPLVENSGTGMDTFKTFNISTAASIIASSLGVPMARHGARAITSQCGTVDMAEALGVDVECPAELVAQSIETSGVGLFNGMSPEIHPRALGRILSQINFGSTLNIAASLANPALPRVGVRGVFARDMILPVARVMKAIGYCRAVVLHGGLDNSDLGMDEASVCGTTWCAELSPQGEISEFSLSPGDFDMNGLDRRELAPTGDLGEESRRFVSLLKGRVNGARRAAAVLNAGLILYAADRADSVEQGLELATQSLDEGAAFHALEGWVCAQNRNPEKGLDRLNKLVREAA